MKRLPLDPFNAFVHRGNLKRFTVPMGRVLEGWKIGVKDNLAVEGWPLTCGSKSLSGYIAPYSGDLVSGVLDLGAEIVGKTNMDEFGMGSRGERSIFGATLNPLDCTKSAGGSSGGSAAAVASGMCRLAFGSDTGGSVRLPASYCGIVGYRPSWGFLSRSGLVSYAPSLDTVGLMARSVGDVVTCLEGLLDVKGRQQGHWQDSTVVDLEQDSRHRHRHRHSAFEPLPLEGLTIGILEEWLDGIGSTLDRVIRVLDAEGARVKLVSIPALKGEECLQRYYQIASMEASSTLARYKSHNMKLTEPVGEFSDHVKRFQEAHFGDEVFRRISHGQELLMHPEGVHFKDCEAYRVALRDSFDALFAVECCDVLIGPTAFSSAPPLTSTNAEEEKCDDVFTVPASLAGLPAISLPLHGIGSGTDGVIGTQLMAARMDDRLLLRVARELERVFK